MSRERVFSVPTSNRAYLAAAAVGGILTLAYALFVTAPLLRGPLLAVDTPSQGMTVVGDTVAVVGHTARVTHLSVNGHPVPLGEDGSFRLERSYPAGYTVFEVRARDRFGREEVRTIRFIHTHEALHGAQKESSADRDQVRSSRVDS